MSDLFVTKLFDFVFFNDDMAFFDEDSKNIMFFSDGLCLNTIDLNNINLDNDNFDDHDPETIIQVR